MNDDSTVAPFPTTKLAAFTHLLSNVMRSKRFLSHLILTLSWCLKNNIKSQWEKFPIQFFPGLWKVTGPRKVTKSLTAFTDKWCFAHRLTSTFGLWVWLEARKIPTRLSSTHRVPRQGSAQECESFSEPVAFLDPHCLYVECRSVYGPSAFDLTRLLWGEIVVAPVDDPLAEEVQTIGRGSRESCIQRTPPPYPLRTTSLEARFPLGHSH